MADDTKFLGTDTTAAGLHGHAEPAVRHDATTGGVIGAVGGALVGALAGGPVGAVIGAVVGGGAAAAAVDVMDKADNDYAHTVVSSRSVPPGQAMSSQTDEIGALYQAASEKNGGFVKIDQKFSGLPLLEGKGGDVVFVYEIVEEMEAMLDFHALQSRFPSLSYPQLVGAVSFLRSLALHNQKGTDLDALLDSDLEQSSQFQEAIVEAMSDEEAVRVLAPL